MKTSVKWVKPQSGRRRPVENVSGRRRPVEKPVVDGRRCRRQADVFITPFSIHIYMFQFA